MMSVTLAAVLATVLCFSVRSTRPLGVIGVFVLVAINPLLFGGLLLLAGLVYFLFFRRADYGVLPQNRILPPDGRSHRRRSGVGLLVLAATAVGLFALAYAPTEDGGIHEVVQGATRSAPAEERIIVVRSVGGLLQTATIKAEEVLHTTFTHRILGVKVGEVEPRIHCVAHYSYHVKLEPEWHVVQRDGVITALAPPLTPSLPVAFDSATVAKFVSGSWLLLPIRGGKDLEALERTVTATLAQKALSDEYKQRALEESRQTIAEFIMNWAVQAGHKDVRRVRVIFEGEPIRSIETIAG